MGFGVEVVSSNGIANAEKARYGAGGETDRLFIGGVPQIARVLDPSQNYSTLETESSSMRGWE